jgi:hypothetical protein
VKTILVGGGYAGFYTAGKPEKKLRRDEAEVIVVDPRPGMTGQPFRPEASAGSVEARHAADPSRRLISVTVVLGRSASAALSAGGVDRGASSGPLTGGVGSGSSGSAAMREPLGAGPGPLAVGPGPSGADVIPTGHARSA